MNKFLQKTRNKILKHIDTIPFVRSQGELNYQKAAENHMINLPVISKNDLDLVEKIKHEGVVITSLADLEIPSTPQLLNAAKNLIPQIPQSNSSNDFVVHASSQQIMEYPEIFLWGLEQRLLNIVEHYIGLPVAYHGAYFRRDLVKPLEIGSRLWHIDTEARSIIKIIIYLNDISEDKGPFQYLPPDLTLKAVHSLNYKAGYVSDKIMQEVISPADYKSCTGSAGTVIFAATSSIFHRGKIPIDTDRFAIFYDYTPRQKNLSFYGGSSLPNADLILLEKGLSEQQKQCIFWQ